MKKQIANLFETIQFWVYLYVAVFKFAFTMFVFIGLLYPVVYLISSGVPGSLSDLVLFIAVPAICWKILNSPRIMNKMDISGPLLP